MSTPKKPKSAEKLIEAALRLVEHHPIVAHLCPSCALMKNLRHEARSYTRSLKARKK